MGERFLQFYRGKLKKEYKFALFSSFIIALLIHIYKFTNTLPHHDSLLNYYSDQNVLKSGRWALSLACSFSSYFDLPWVVGVLSCIFIALTVVLIVAIFKIENPIVILLTGALISSSPAITDVLFYLYTADGYMIAMFLAALSVYFSVVPEKRISRLILSGVCICISCGIYQAYVPFGLVLAVCYFINVLFSGNHDKKDCLKWVLRQAIIYISALAAYYIIWKICLHINGTTATTYQGISEVGKFSFSLLQNGLVQSVKSLLLYFFEWNIFEHGLNVYSVLNILFFIALFSGIVIATIKSGILKRKWAVVLLVLCLLAIVPFACMWHFTSDSVS